MLCSLARCWAPFRLTCRTTLHTNGFDGLRRSRRLGQTGASTWIAGTMPEGVDEMSSETVEIDETQAQQGALVDYMTSAA